MGFLPIFYAGAYFLAASAGYLFCTQLLTRLRGIAKAVFVAILAFGACSYIGFIVIILAVGALGPKILLGGTLGPIIYAVAYVLPGLAGAWLSLKALKSSSPGHP